MSRHWKPEDKIVAIRSVGGRRNFGRQQGYWQDSAPKRQLPSGAVAGLVLVAAACVGTGVGLYQTLGPREVRYSGGDTKAAPAAAAPVETLIPETQDDGADAEWTSRAEGQSGSSTHSGPNASGVSVHVGSCKWGGGTNCVVDGDTIYLHGQKIRIAGIDAPETHDYRCAGELALGEQAARQLQAMLNSGAVTMTSVDRDRDVYGRLLRNVAVDGQDVGEAMISAGVARAYAGGRRSWC